jgi:hypothetical protein
MASPWLPVSKHFQLPFCYCYSWVKGLRETNSDGFLPITTTNAFSADKADGSGAQQARHGLRLHRQSHDHALHALHGTSASSAWPARQAPAPTPSAPTRRTAAAPASPTWALPPPPKPRPRYGNADTWKITRAVKIESNRKKNDIRTTTSRSEISQYDTEIRLICGQPSAHKVRKVRDSTSGALSSFFLRKGDKNAPDKLRWTSSMWIQCNLSAVHQG